MPKRDRRTRKTTLAELEDDLTYTAPQLDRDVVAPDQIRARSPHVPQTPIQGRFSRSAAKFPRTLVFAKQDSHADDIVKIVKEEFGKGQRLLPEDHLKDDRRPPPRGC